MVLPDKLPHSKIVKSESRVRLGPLKSLRRDSAEDRPLVATRHDCSNVQKSRAALAAAAGRLPGASVNTSGSFRQLITRAARQSEIRPRGSEKIYLFTLNNNRRYLQRVTKVHLKKAKHGKNQWN